MSLPDRIAARTRSVSVADVVKTVLALPFYVVGWLIGVTIFVLSWVWAAVVVGFTDGRRKAPGS